MTRCRFCEVETEARVHSRHEAFCARNPAAQPRRRPRDADGASAGTARGAPRARRRSAPPGDATGVVDGGDGGAPNDADADDEDGASAGSAEVGGAGGEYDAVDYDGGAGAARADASGAEPLLVPGAAAGADAGGAALGPGGDGAAVVVAPAPADATDADVSARAFAQRRFERAMRMVVRRRYRFALGVAFFVRTRNSIVDAQILLNEIGASPPGAAYLRAEAGVAVTAEAMHKHVSRTAQLWVRTLRGAADDGRVREHRIAVPRSIHALGVAGTARSFSMPVPLAVMSWLRSSDVSCLLTFMNALEAPATAPCPPPPHAGKDMDAHMLALDSPAIFSACYYAAQHLRNFVIPIGTLTLEQRMWPCRYLPLPIALSTDGVGLTRSRVRMNSFEVVSIMNLLLDENELKRPHHVRTLALLASLGGAVRSDKRMAFAQQFRDAVAAPLVDLYKHPMVLTDLLDETVVVVAPVVVAIIADHQAMTALLSVSAARCSACAVPKRRLGRVLAEPLPARDAVEVALARANALALPVRRRGAHLSDAERAANDELKRLGVWAEPSALAPLEEEYGLRVLGPCGYFGRICFAVLHSLYLGPTKDICLLIESMVKANGMEAAMIARVANIRYYTNGVRIIYTFPDYTARGEIPGAQYRDLLLAFYTALGEKPDMLPAETHENVVRVCETALDLIALLRHDVLNAAERLDAARLGARLVQIFPDAFDTVLTAAQARLERFKLHALAHELERSIANFGSPALINDAVLEASYKQLKTDFELTKRDRTAGAAVLQHGLKRLFWLSNADMLFDKHEPSYPRELAGTRPVLKRDEPRSVAAVGRAVALTSDASGHAPDLVARLAAAWVTYCELLDGVDRARFYGGLYDFELPHKVGAQFLFRAWIFNAAEEMYGTVVALPMGAPRHAHAATGGGDATAPRERYDFVEIVCDPPQQHRTLAQLCAIFTVPTRSGGGAAGGPGREAFVLLRYLTAPQTQPPFGSTAGFVTLTYNERRFFSNKNGNPANAAAAPRYVVESLETVSRSWPVRQRVISRGGIANVSEGFYSPRVL